MVIFLWPLHLVCSNFSSLAYQSTERVSVRLAAMQPQAMLPQRGPPVPGVLPPPGHGMYLPHGVVQFVPLMMPTPPKRPLEPVEEEPPAPKKRSRGKNKATDGQYTLVFMDCVTSNQVHRGGEAR